MQRDDARHKSAMSILMALCLASLALSGCTLDRALDRVDAPTAKLEVDEPVRYAGEAFVFDASGSVDHNGRIRSYVIDFGDGDSLTIGEGGSDGPQDGNNTTQGQDDPAAVEHAYERPGEYLVTLTVTDDGRNQGKARSATDDLVVAVNDRGNVSGFVVQSPLGLEGAANMTHEVEALEGADHLNATLDVSGRALVGDSTVVVRVLDPDGTAIVDETVTVPAGGNQTVAVAAPIPGPGAYTFSFEAESGAADISGVYTVLYHQPIGRPTDTTPPQDDPANVTGRTAVPF